MDIETTRFEKRKNRIDTKIAILDIETPTFAISLLTGAMNMRIVVIDMAIIGVKMIPDAIYMLIEDRKM